MRTIHASAALLALAAGAASPLLTGPQDPAATALRAQHVGGTVYVIEGQNSGNIGVSVGEDGVVMIDSQFAPLSEQIRAAIAALGRGDQVRFLINTHWHGDHVGGNANFAPQAAVLAHANVRRRMQEGLPERQVPPSPAEALPVLTFDRGVSLHLNGEEIQVLHTISAHTDGDSVVLFAGSKVAHLGDLYFSGRFPFVDLASGGDVLGLEAQIEEILHGLPEDVRIIPGHGPVSTLEDLRLYHRMLRETIETVRQAMAAGRSLEQIQEQGLAEAWQDWSWGFIDETRWIQIIHQSLERQPVRPRPGAPR